MFAQHATVCPGHCSAHSKVALQRGQRSARRRSQGRAAKVPGLSARRKRKGRATPVSASSAQTAACLTVLQGTARAEARRLQRCTATRVVAQWAGCEHPARPERSGGSCRRCSALGSGWWRVGTTTCQRASRKAPAGVCRSCCATAANPTRLLTPPISAIIAAKTAEHVACVAAASRLTTARDKPRRTARHHSESGRCCVGRRLGCCGTGSHGQDEPRKRDGLEGGVLEGGVGTALGSGLLFAV
jgi:hypothetical protein